MMYSQQFITVVKVGNKVLREQGESVYIPFGSEYSVLLKNLSSVKAVASINIDGTSVMKGRQVIVPAHSEVELEGFTDGMDVTNKFKFIEKTDEIAEFRGNKVCDGLIDVSFSFEKERVYHSPYGNHNIFNNSFPDTNDGPWRLGASRSVGFNGVGKSKSKLRSNSSDALCSFSSQASSSFNDNGITVKGSSSDQSFSIGHVNELEDKIHHIILQLKGKLNKATVKQVVTVKTKIACTTCGRKNRSNNKFCANCGTALF
jgi:hypothetical protein